MLGWTGNQTDRSQRMQRICYEHHVTAAGRREDQGAQARPRAVHVVAVAPPSVVDGGRDSAHRDRRGDGSFARFTLVPHMQRALAGQHQTGALCGLGPVPRRPQLVRHRADSVAGHIGIRGSETFSFNSSRESIRNTCWSRGCAPTPLSKASTWCSRWKVEFRRRHGLSCGRSKPSMRLPITISPQTPDRLRRARDGGPACALKRRLLVTWVASWSPIVRRNAAR